MAAPAPSADDSISSLAPDVGEWHRRVDSVVDCLRAQRSGTRSAGAGGASGGTSRGRGGTICNLACGWGLFVESQSDLFAEHCNDRADLSVVFYLGNRVFFRGARE